MSRRKPARLTSKEYSELLGNTEGLLAQHRQALSQANEALAAFHANTQRYPAIEAWWRLRPEARRAYQAYRLELDAGQARYWWLQNVGQQQGSFAIVAKHYLERAAEAMPAILDGAVRGFLTSLGLR